MVKEDQATLKGIQASLDLLEGLRQQQPAV